jgi:cyclopropane-fatty-acyl-phospholipid synthase
MGALDTLLAPLRSREAPEAVARRIHATIARAGVDIPVRLWDGSAVGRADASYRLVLHHPWSLRALLVPRTDRAAGEAYAFDAVDVEGSLIDALGDIAALAADGRLGALDRLTLIRDLLALEPPPPHWSADHRRQRMARLSGAKHSIGRDTEAVRHHYDLGNDFYRLFLDDGLVYSCAYFAPDDPVDPAEDPQALERAQVRKMELVCRKLRLQPGERLLDIGCGWGSLVLHAARHHGVRAVGITIAEEQAALARERVAAAGLADRVEIRLADYREEHGQHDAVASVGMFEHVGENRFRTYFEHAFALTRPGGRFLNHAITTGRRGVVRDLSEDSGSFVGAYVFPDGVLAPAHRHVRHLEQAGFELVDVQQLRPHYARTLRHWVHRLEDHAEEARRSADDVTYRIWRAYMAGSAVGFATGDLGVVQVLGVRPPSALPLGRAWMEPQPREPGGLCGPERRA